jgi:hypothetical protein
VQLTNQRSGSPCQQGYSWGYDRRGIWVDHGCRADFLERGSAVDCDTEMMQAGLAPVQCGSPTFIQPKTRVAAPPAISKPPTILCTVRPSPKNIQAKRMTSTTLSLSMGATDDAGPSCSARK